MSKAHTRTAGQRIPLGVLILLVILQAICYFAIISFESASIYYDAGRGTIYAGYWCSLAFLITCIAMWAFLCCRGSSSCGIYLMIQNIISAIFAIILIVFTALFINDPCLCFGTLCQIPTWDSIESVINDGNLRYACNARTYDKLRVLKALLTFAVLMLVSNLIFILAYVICSILSRRKPPRTINSVAHSEGYAYEGPPRIVYYDEYQPQTLTVRPSDIRYYDGMDEQPNRSPEIRAVRF